MSDLDDLIEAFASASVSTKIAAKEPLADALNHVWQERVKKCRAELAALRSTAARVRNEALDQCFDLVVRQAKAADRYGEARMLIGDVEGFKRWSMASDEIVLVAEKIRALRATSETESNPEEKA